MRHTASVSTAALALLFTAACDSADRVVDAQPARQAASQAAPQAFRTPDDEFARASRAEAPGFAGYYFQADGTPVIRVTDQKNRGQVQRYLAQTLAEARRGRLAMGPSQPVFVSAEHDFAELKGWADALHPTLQQDGVYLIDVDEVENRVLVGVGHPSAAAGVRAEAVRLGIPANALEVRTQPKPEVRATLQQKLTNMVGGLQIAFGNYVCTLGFPATRNATGATVFVTNSHCTNTQYVSDGIAIYQSTVVAGSQIGNEVADRGMWACAGAGTSCRQSDAAYISHNGTRTIGQGGIARTPWATGGSGSLTISGEYDIIGRSTSIAVGAYLDKTGRTSGTTYGQVTNSCVTIGSLRCQDISKVWSMGGDSGSPIYVYVGGAGAAENDVRLHGVMWGGPGSDYTTTYSSRLAGIEADLGALSNLCRPGYGC